MHPLEVIGSHTAIRKIRNHWLRLLYTAFADEISLICGCLRLNRSAVCQHRRCIGCEHPSTSSSYHLRGSVPRLRISRNTCHIAERRYLCGKLEVPDLTHNRPHPKSKGAANAKTPPCQSGPNVYNEADLETGGIQTCAQPRARGNTESIETSQL